jgi:hypothetical protein
MAGERRARVLSAVAASGDSGEHEAARLCAVAVDVLGVTGAGLMLMHDNEARGSLCSTDAVSRLMEELQFDLGEGPCVDAHRHHRPVLEPDLADPVQPRWLAFTPPVVDAGARAVFGFPMQLGAVRLGALNVYCDTPGLLTDDQHADALVMADVAAQAVISLQSHAPPGMLATELEAGSDFRLVVHQAVGMVSAHLDITVTEALIRMRGYAFAHDQRLTAVAEDVIARRLHLP